MLPVSRAVRTGRSQCGACGRRGQHWEQRCSRRTAGAAAAVVRHRERRRRRRQRLPVPVPCLLTSAPPTTTLDSNAPTHSPFPTMPRHPPALPHRLMPARVRRKESAERCTEPKERKARRPMLQLLYQLFLPVSQSVRLSLLSSNENRDDRRCHRTKRKSGKRSAMKWHETRCQQRLRPALTLPVPAHRPRAPLAPLHPHRKSRTISRRVSMGRASESRNHQPDPLFRSGTRRQCIG